MSTKITVNSMVVRSERGLSLAGTRITLYDVMDYLHAGWPAKLIRDRLNLSDEQMTEVMTYIEGHQKEVNDEYEAVLKTAQENRQYWEERNKERLSQVSSQRNEPDQQVLRAKLAVWKARVERSG